MLIPVLLAWGRRINVPASKLMIPLSYAAMVGGMCTTIGGERRCCGFAPCTTVGG